MAKCSNCLHFEVCAIRHEKICKGTLVEGSIHNCTKFEDRTKWKKNKGFVTNADRIRAMTDAELADWLIERGEWCDFCANRKSACFPTNESWCRGGILGYLTAHTADSTQTIAEHIRQMTDDELIDWFCEHTSSCVFCANEKIDCWPREGKCRAGIKKFFTKPLRKIGRVR